MAEQYGDREFDLALQVQANQWMTTGNMALMLFGVGIALYLAESQISAGVDLSLAGQQKRLDQERTAPGHAQWLPGLGHPLDQISAPQQFGSNNAYRYELVMRIEEQGSPRPLK